MAISLYALSVETNRQIVAASIETLDIAHKFAIENNIDPDTLLERQIIEDMWPLSGQLISIRHHSLGSIRGIQAGLFEPPPKLPAMNYTEYQQYLVDALAELDAFTEADINELEGKSLIFRIGKREIPFIAEHFVRSFSLPNLHFHAATAYNLLRKEGVPIGKLNFIGKLQTG